MSNRRARINDLLALLTAIIIIGVDQWTKALVVEKLSPPESRAPIPLIGNYLTIYYIRNSGVAFSMFTNSAMLAVLIVLAIGVIAYLYWRILDTGTLLYKLIFGMVIGGATGNLIDRAIRGGSVVDFIYFRIPQIGYSFAIFNLADASISVGVFFLFVFMLFGNLGRSKTGNKDNVTIPDQTIPPTSKSGTLS